MPDFDRHITNSAQQCRGLRMALGIFSMNLLVTVSGYSQRGSTSFGALADYHLEFTPIGLTAIVRPVPDEVEIAVLSKERHSFHFFSLGADARFVQSHMYMPSRNLKHIQAEDINGDGEPEILGIAEDGLTLTIFTHTGTSYGEQHLQMREPIQRVSVADLNNDKRKDLLAYGRGRAGIVTFLARPNGTFAEGPVLFGEVSVSDLKAADLNGDGITDLLLLDWLSNQLNVYYGIGRGIFSEQLTVDLPGEPDDLAITPVTKERMITVAITLPEQHRIAVYKGTSLGEFEVATMIPVQDRTNGISIADLNSDGLKDIVTCTDKGIAVAMGVSGTQFRSPVVFAAGTTIVTWEITDLDRDRRPDLILVDRATSKLTALANAGASGTVTWPAEYSVGKSPGGLSVRDFDGDSHMDIAVANTSSSTISILHGLGEGRMSGQQSFPVPEHPDYVKAFLINQRPMRTLVTAHSVVDRITILTLSGSPDSMTSYSMPTGRNPYVLFARQRQDNNKLELLVRSASSREGYVALSLFEQIDGGQFLERSLRPTLPDRITALTVDEVREPGSYDLVFLTHDKGTKTSTLSISTARPGFDFRNATPILSFADSVSSPRVLLTGDVNGDGLKDIVIAMQAPKNSLGLCYATAAGEFRNSLLWVSDVGLVSEDSFLVQDADGDGRMDVIMIDSVRKSVIVLYGQPGGKLESPRVVCSAQGVNGIRVAPMKHPPVQDLVLSNGSRGTVSILYSPFRR